MKFRSSLIALTLLAASAGPAWANPVPLVLAKVVAARAAQAVVLTAERERRQEIRYPGNDTVSDISGIRLISGLRVVSVKVKRDVESGKETSAADLAKLQAAADKVHFGEFNFLLPTEPSQLADFTYGAPVLSGKTAAIGFHSLKRDQTHCDGTIYIDTALAQIVKIDYVPAVLPESANHGSGTITMGEVLPGIWEMVRDESHYSGQKFFIKGYADIVITQSHYRKFPNQAAAEKAM